VPAHWEAFKIRNDDEKWTQAMNKEPGWRARLEEERRESCVTRIEAAKDGDNIEGIFMALRYLSLEAVEAGLIDLAKVLDAAVRQYGHYISRSGERL
jgi:hypothetical protein